MDICWPTNKELFPSLVHDPTNLLADSIRELTSFEVVLKARDDCNPIEVDISGVGVCSLDADDGAGKALPNSDKLREPDLKLEGEGCVLHEVSVEILVLEHIKRVRCRDE